jgi:hypothetical protein
VRVVLLPEDNSIHSTPAQTASARVRVWRKKRPCCLPCTVALPRMPVKISMAGKYPSSASASPRQLSNARMSSSLCPVLSPAEAIACRHDFRLQLARHSSKPPRVSRSTSALQLWATITPAHAELSSTPRGRRIAAGLPPLPENITAAGKNLHCSSDIFRQSTAIPRL